MRFTLSWLKKFLDTDKSLEEIVNTLTDLGLEVEEVVDRSKDLAIFEVAEIVSTSRHPAADKLQVCEVNSSSGNLRIVCGAQNARAGIKVVLAKVGALIPNGNFKIKESEIRGVKSHGMLCSELELEVGNDESGIIELPSDAIVGESFIKYYGLDDPVIHINITPNRGDALGVYGIARDLAARGVGLLKQLGITEVKPKVQSKFELKVENKDLCPKFFALEINNLENNPSPDWLKNLLTSIGIGSVSAVVDVTNYIAYSFGQPMHAYDADKLQGGLSVSVLQAEDKISALNGKDYRLEAGDLVIRDQSKVQCLAGIIGAQDSSIDIATKHIILEAAVFDSMCITKTGRRLDIQTDSRYRFERKVDSNNVENVLKIAAAIINDICGGQNGQIIFAKADGIAQAKVIRTSAAFINKRLGFEIDQGKVSSILLSLGFRVKIEAGVIEVTVPSWRHDISIQEDLVEEVIRVYGYDKIPAVPFPGYEITSVIPKEDKRKFDVKRVMASAGYDEVVTWSFMDHKLANTFGEVNEDLVLKNPISSDLGVMRQTIMPNLLSIIAKNNARSINDLSLFEVGPIFKGIEPEDESCYLAAVKSGVSNPNNCHDSSRLVDIFDIKADLDLVLRNIGLSVEKCQISFNIPAYYHPMRSAALSLGKNVIAYFGQIHPSLLKEVGIEQDVIAFELNLDSVPFSKPKFGRKEEFTASPFQPSERDYAFVMDEKQLAGEMVSCIKNIDKKLIRSVEIFDIYKGEKLDQGQKSVALRVKIQSDDKTLTEEELSAVSSKIISSLEQRFSAKLRS